MNVLMKALSLSVFITVLVSCGGGGNVKPQNKTLVKTSAASEPAWVMLGKNSGGSDLYFVGRAENTPGFKDAKEAAMNDAVKQILQYIGFQATHEFKVSKQIAAGSMDPNATKTEILDSISGKGSAKVSVDVNDIYYEQYSDDTYNVSVLLKLPKSWIEAEKLRLEKQIKEQRDTALKFLSDSAANIKEGNITAALDNAVSALYISVFAAENKDVYDNAKAAVYDILSGFTFSLKNKPAFVYKEGGSDSIEVIAGSSKTGKPAAGLLTAAYEENNMAEMLAKNGYSCDANGLVIYEARGDSKYDKDIVVRVSFSLSKFDDLKAIDEEFYNKVAKLQNSLALVIPLKKSAKMLAVPTAVVGISMVFDKKDKKPVKKPQIVPQMQDQLAGLFANQNFNIISVEIPDSVFSEGIEESSLKTSIIDYMKQKYPDVKRLLFAVEVVTLLGKTKDIVGPNSGFENEVSVGVSLSFSIIDVDTSKLEKSAKVNGGAYAATPQQAVQIARKNLFDKLKKQIEEMGK